MIQQEVDIEAVLQQDITVAKTYLQKVKDKTKTALRWVDKTYGPIEAPWKNIPRSPKKFFSSALHQLTRNLRSSLTVCLVNIPLSISLVLASGGVPVQGIITAIWSGWMYAFFGGSSYNIVGPSGSIMGMLSIAAMQYGSDILPFVSILAGLLTMSVFALRLDRFFIVPSGVTTGFALGAAIIIALNQLQLILGIDTRGMPKHSEFYMNVFQVLSHIGNTNWYAVILFSLSFLMTMFMALYTPQIPAALIMAVAGMFFGALVDQGLLPHFQLHTIGSRYGNIQTAIALLPRWPTGIDVDFVDLFSCAASVSFVSILETLISSKIAANMTNTEVNNAKDIFGLGFANTVCGLVGGIPASAALARTALNIKTGAISSFSGFMNSVWVAIISLLLLKLFQYMLLPFVATILMLVAYRTVDINDVIQLFKRDKKGFILSLLIASVVVLHSPAGGIVFGVITALLLYAHRNSNAPSAVHIEQGKEENMVGHIVDEHMIVHTVDVTYNTKQIQGNDYCEEEILSYTIPYELSYVNGNKHIERVKKFKGYNQAILNLKHMYVIDMDGKKALEEIIKIFDEKTEGGTRLVLRKNMMPKLQNEPWFADKLEKHLIFNNGSEAVKAISQKPAT